MTRASFVERLRQRQYVHMSDEATVTRSSGDVIFNPSDGTYSQPSGTVYDGRCEIGGPNRGVSAGFDIQTGQAELRLLDVPAKFPVGTPLAKDDTVTVVGSLHNPWLIGRVYRITDVVPVRASVYQHVTLEEVVD
jgi:hypothetical protein